MMLYSGARSNRKLYAIVFAVVLTSCAHRSSVPNLFDTQQKIDSYIASGQYEADVQKVADSATRYLEMRAKSGGKLAIVLDIDETSLSNWPAYKVNGYARITNGDCDLEKGPCGLRAWQAMGKSQPIRPTLHLAQRAKELGVAVFFISGRPPALKEATERNLRDAGYDYDGVIIYPSDAHFASASDFKAPERKKLTEQGWTILLTMGDQWSDLSGGYAEKTFKLPNPVYYLP